MAAHKAWGEFKTGPGGSVEIGERVMQLETQMSDVQRGVSNFRAYQLKSARHQGYMKAMAAIITVLMGMIFWTARTAVEEFRPAFKVLIREYVKDHPDIKGEIPKMSDESSREPVYAVERPNYATIPSLAR